MQVPARIPDNQFPLLPEDRHIDALGTEANIHSPADAETYLNAILAKHKIDTATIPGLSPFAHRLAVAEYAAITDPSKRIPETQLVTAFNEIMDQWGEPQWTRITVEDFHWFHRIKAATLIPYSVSRDAEGNVADTCRPVEAVYLLYMLTTERGLQPDKLPTLPASFGTKPVFMSHSASLSVAPFGDDIGRRDTAFRKAENNWLQSHPDPTQQIGRLFDALHIE